MPWSTPTLKDVRGLVRDNVRASLPGADASVPNSVLRVLSDAQGGLCHLTLQYVDWLALQLLPDTAETEWLDRHGAIWLVNADGSRGRKAATFAQGAIAVTGTSGTPIPVGAILTGPSAQYQTTSAGVIDFGGAGSVNAGALTAGAVGNAPDGTSLSFNDQVAGLFTATCSGDMTGGVDTETDDQLRARILFRIQQPPMGGDANDYVAWAMAVPGVTRAWASVEMGIGTITVRFMMDTLRADNNGFPLGSDIQTVTDYLNTVRPVAIKDMFVEAPVPEPIDFTISGLINDTDTVRGEIEIAVTNMLLQNAEPAHSVNGQMVPATTIYAAWVSEAIMESVGVVSFTLEMDDHPMPYNGSLGVLGTILHER